MLTDWWVALVLEKPSPQAFPVLDAIVTESATSRPMKLSVAVLIGNCSQILRPVLIMSRIPPKIQPSQDFDSTGMLSLGPSLSCQPQELL